MRRFLLFLLFLLPVSVFGQATLTSTPFTRQMLKQPSLGAEQTFLGIGAATGASLAQVTNAIIQNVATSLGGLSFSGAGPWSLVAANTAGFWKNNGSGVTSWSAPVEGDLSWSDITTLNVSLSKHGLVPKLPPGGTGLTFLNDLGAWSTPAGGGTVTSVGLSLPSGLSVAGSPVTGSGTLAVTAQNTSGFFKDAAGTTSWAAPVEGDLSWSDILTLNVSTTKHGLAPKLPNDATQFLNGVGAWAVPAGGGGSAFPLATDGNANNFGITNLSKLGGNNGSTVTFASASPSSAWAITNINGKLLDLDTNGNLTALKNVFAQTFQGFVDTTNLPNTGTPGTYTKTTFNSKGLETSGSAAQLASADFANQGTTTTLLHGNAAGNPSFGAVVENDQSLSDVTTLNVSTSKHGYVPKLPNDATKYLDGSGAFSVPSGGGGSSGPTFRQSGTNHDFHYRRWSYAMPQGNSSTASWGPGENWTASGNVGTIVEASASLPVASPLYTSTTINSDAGINNNGFGFMFAGKHILWGTRIFFGNTNAMRAWFCVTRGSMSTMDGSDTPAVIFAGFRWSDAVDGTIKFCTSDGTTTTATDTGLRPVIQTPYLLEMYEDVAHSALIAYTNGVASCTNTTHIPTGDKMQSSWSLRNLTAASATNYLSEIYTSCDP
jgi:hypothetical protein